MKLYLLALFAVLVGGTFVDFLNSLQTHSSFQRLPEEEKLLFGQLVVAAENDELTEFIDRVGLIRVLKLMDHMSHYDAEKFAAYLAEHTNYTHHAPDHGDVINRRAEGDLLEETVDARRQLDNDNGDRDHHSGFYNYLVSLNNRYYDHLPSQEQQVYHDLVDAIRTHNVTGYIDTQGYGPVFGLIEHLDAFHANQVYDYLVYALRAESGETSTNKILYQHNGKPYSLHHTGRVLHRKMILDGCLQSIRMIPRAGEVLKHKAQWFDSRRNDNSLELFHSQYLVSLSEPPNAGSQNALT